jgi:hypothetical protein
MTVMAGVNAAVPPTGAGCAECEVTGGWWVHLRRCADCGHVGCCDTSPPSMPRCTGALPATQLSRTSNLTKSGSGTTRLRKPSPVRDWPRLAITRSASQFPDRVAEFPLTGNSTFISAWLRRSRPAGITRIR